MLNNAKSGSTDGSEKLRNILAVIGISALIIIAAGAANFQRVQGVTVDDSSHGLITVSCGTNATNTGDHYFIKTYFRDAGDANSITYFSYTTPDSEVEIHANAKALAYVDYTIEIYEDATITGGTPLVEMNNDRNSSNTALLVAIAAPTVTVPGNLIWAARTGGGDKEFPVGISPAINYQILAKRNSTYVFKLIKNVGDTGIVDVDFWWYEATDIE